MDYFQNKIICSSSHASNIQFFCTIDGIFCCEECAINHLDHSEGLESLKSIYTKKLSEYQKLRSLTNIFSRIEFPQDEIKSLIYQKLENGFDLLITRIANMRALWISKQFTYITKALEELKPPDIKNIQNEIEKAIIEIENYVDSEQNLYSKKLFQLKQPEIFEQEIRKARKRMKRKNAIKTFEVDINFKSKLLRKIINIKDIPKRPSIPITSTNINNIQDHTNIINNTLQAESKQGPQYMS